MATPELEICHKGTHLAATHPGHGTLALTTESSWMFLSDQTALSNLIRRLQITSKHLARDPLWQELWTLSRLIYRNNNQHRRAVFFQRILQVRKQLVRLQATDLPTTLRRLSGLFPTARDIQQCGDWREARFPARSEAVYVLDRLSSYTRLASQTMDLINEVARSLHHMLGTGEFMPFALTTVALVARVRLLLFAQSYELRDLYAALLPYSRVLPSISPAEEIASHLPAPMVVPDHKRKGKHFNESSRDDRVNDSKQDHSASTEDLGESVEPPLSTGPQQRDDDAMRTSSVLKPVAHDTKAKKKNRTGKESGDRTSIGFSASASPIKRTQPPDSPSSVTKKSRQEPSPRKAVAMATGSTQTFWLQHSPRSNERASQKKKKKKDRDKNRDDLDELFDMLSS